MIIYKIYSIYALLRLAKCSGVLPECVDVLAKGARDHSHPSPIAIARMRTSQNLANVKLYVKKVSVKLAMDQNI